ncbi:MAG: ATP-binding protein [Actinomycetota bacterium]|nr:ATP-binding protein [Actinomycetota bacterium]
MNSERIVRHSRSFDAVPFAASEARSFVGVTLRDGGASQRAVDDFRLVVSELVANLVEHGDGAGFDVYVEGPVAGAWVLGIECAVAAAGASLPDPHAWAVADPDEASGRGLGIVRTLMDDITLEAADGRLTIRCIRHST